MKKHAVVIIAVASLASTLMGANSVIGIAVSQGKLEVDNALVDGNANLSSGAVVRTAGSPSRLQLLNGANLVLDRESQAKIYSDHVVLERGVSQLSGRNAYAVEAKGFRVSADSAQARVEVKKDYVVVAALTGAVKVTDANGLPVANIAQGRALGFAPSTSGQISESTMKGKLVREQGRYALADEVTGLKVELQGNQALDREVGKRVQITGAPKTSADRSGQVIQVAKLNRLGDEPAPTPAPGPTPNPTPKAPPPPVSNAAAVWIVVGTLAAVGATAGALASTSR